ncbi:hypothetical protein MRX96_028897 [Rhipicephalus microplus]
MEGSLCDMYDRDSQMMRVLMAGNAHYLRERSATFGRTSTLDETLYICQQIGRQQEPPLPPRPATAASEVFVTRSTTALGSSCEDHEPLRLPPPGPAVTKALAAAPPQLLPPIPRPRRPPGGERGAQRSCIGPRVGERVTAAAEASDKVAAQGSRQPELDERASLGLQRALRAGLGRSRLVHLAIPAALKRSLFWSVQALR